MSSVQPELPHTNQARLIGAGTKVGGNIVCAGRYDADGKLVETIDADENGSVFIQTSGIWLFVTKDAPDE